MRVTPKPERLQVRKPRPHVIAPVEIPKVGPEAGWPARLDNWAERVVVRCEEMGVASVIRTVTSALLLLLPLVAGFPFAQDLLKNRSLAAFVATALLVVAATSTMFQRHRNAAKQRRQASELEQAMDGISRASGSLGGGIQSLTEALRLGNRKLVEEDSRSTCIALLARIHEVATVVLPRDRDVRLRVTLAVPIVRTGVPEGRGAPASTTVAPECLRVWCYDRTHGDRHWTTLSLDSPGAAEAYRTGEIAYIPDMRALPGPSRTRARSFGSVVSVPVAGRPDGRPLAVVNIDASEPNYFDLALVIARLHPLILPGVQAIGLALQARKEAEHYVFGR